MGPVRRWTLSKIKSGEWMVKVVMESLPSGCHEGGLQAVLLTDQFLDLLAHPEDLVEASHAVHQLVRHLRRAQHRRPGQDGVAVIEVLERLQLQLLGVQEEGEPEAFQE